MKRTVAFAAILAAFMAVPVAANASSIDGSCCTAIASSAWQPTNVGAPLGDADLWRSHNAGMSYWHGRSVYPCTNTYRLADFGSVKALAVTQLRSCTTYINRGYWSGFTFQRMSTGLTRTNAERKLCKIVTHEQGHSAGRDHTSTVGTTMYPYVSQMPLSNECAWAWL